MKILVTGGGCEEAIDGVRSIINSSTGKTSAFISDYLVNNGHTVTLLAGKRAVLPEGSVQCHRFTDFQSLNELLKFQLSQFEWDAVIHAAAVSDYSVSKVYVDGEAFEPGEIHKLDSSGDINISLKKNPKLIEQIKDWSKNSETILIGFKLTRYPDDDVRDSLVGSLFDRARPDLVVWNALSEISDNGHFGRIYRNIEDYIGFTTKKQMAEILLQEIKEILQ